jgi:hypothetical protein
LKKQSNNFTLPLKLNRFNPKPLRFSSSPKISATISIGDKLSESTFSYLDPAGEVQTVTVFNLTKGKKAVLFAVPGAKGVDTIACISVNDAFVIFSKLMIFSSILKTTIAYKLMIFSKFFVFSSILFYNLSYLFL